MTRMTRIVLPLDGTTQAERALPTVVTLAKTLRTEVLLVRAHSDERAPRRGAWYKALTARPPSAPAHVASLYLARVEQDLRVRGVRAQSWLTPSLAPDAILDATLRGPGDLIVLATQLASSGRRHLPSASVAAALLAQADVPVLLLGMGSDSAFEHHGGSGLRVLPLYDAECGIAGTHPPHRYAELLTNAFDGRVIRPEANHSDGLAPAQHPASPESFRWTCGADMRIDLSRLARFARDAADLIVMSKGPEPSCSAYAIEMPAYLLRMTRLPLLVTP
jgi:nucleotide-binding universal stress UspA family protein